MLLAKDVVAIENGCVNLLQHIPGTKEEKQAYFSARNIRVPRTNYERMWEALTSRLFLDGAGNGGSIRIAKPKTEKQNVTAVAKEPTRRLEIALTFAGEDRLYVEQVASVLKARGVRVFYDLFDQVDLLGKDLSAHLGDIYKNQADYCAMFISQYYAQ